MRPALTSAASGRHPSARGRTRAGGGRPAGVMRRQWIMGDDRPADVPGQDAPPPQPEPQPGWPAPAAGWPPPAWAPPGSGIRRLPRERAAPPLGIAGCPRRPGPRLGAAAPAVGRALFRPAGAAEPDRPAPRRSRACPRRTAGFGWWRWWPARWCSRPRSASPPRSWSAAPAGPRPRPPAAPPPPAPRRAPPRPRPRPSTTRRSRAPRGRRDSTTWPRPSPGARPPRSPATPASRTAARSSR